MMKIYFSSMYEYIIIVTWFHFNMYIMLHGPSVCVHVRSSDGVTLYIYSRKLSPKYFNENKIRDMVKQTCTCTWWVHSYEYTMKNLWRVRQTCLEIVNVDVRNRLIQPDFLSYIHLRLIPPRSSLVIVLPLDLSSVWVYYLKVFVSLICLVIY